MKKILSLMIAAVLLFSALPLTAIYVSASSVDVATVSKQNFSYLVRDGIEYTVSYWTDNNGKINYDDCEAEITGYTGSASELIIPSIVSETIFNATVTKIRHSAFENCTKLRKITLPDTINIIPNSAFAECTNLEFFDFPDSIVSIGNSAFRGCEKLKLVNIPDSVTSIGQDAFYDTAWYDEQLEGMSYAGKVAYQYKGECPTTVDIKDGTLGIAGGAFSAFDIGDNLEKITIPDSILSIGEYAFFCQKLRDVIIPDSVTDIGEGAFYNCQELINVTIGNSTKSIGEHAFADCINLKSITVPKSVSYFGEGALGYYFDSDDYVGISGFTIYGYSGTEAERYANDNCFTFIPLGDEPEKPYILGDADGNGEIESVDATYIQRYIAKIDTPYTKTELLRADVDGSGDLELLDVTCIQRYLANLKTDYPIGQTVS